MNDTDEYDIRQAMREARDELAAENERCFQQLELKQALFDEIEIRHAGLWDQYRADIEYHRTLRKPVHLKLGTGPLSRMHGDRWKLEYLGTTKADNALAHKVGCDFAAEHGVTLQSAIGEARTAVNDSLTRVRQRWATLARLQLLGVEIELPEAGQEVSSIVDNNHPSSRAKTETIVSQSPAKPAPVALPVVTVMQGAAR